MSAITTSLVSARLPDCLVTIIIDYFSRSIYPYSMGEFGQYEDCLVQRDNDAIKSFLGACYGGHIEIVDVLSTEIVIAYSASGLIEACSKGHIGIAELMIAHGAACLNRALAEACQFGHIKIVDMLIARGANDCDWGLIQACAGGHVEIAELMIAKGALNMTTALSYACQNGHRNLVKLMVAHGTRRCNCGADHWAAQMIK